MKKHEAEPLSVSSFHDGVADLMKQVACRQVVAADDLEDVFRLRYESYLREGAITANSKERFHDRYDELPNTWILGFYIGGRLASSLRVSVASYRERDVPGMMAFSDILSPLLEAEKIIVDPTRFVIDYEHARLHPKLAFVTSRASWLATEHFNADYTISTVRAEHQAFYRRYHGQKVICSPRRYPTLVKPLSLMLGVFSQSQHILIRYPFLRSTIEEREDLFRSPLARLQLVTPGRARRPGPRHLSSFNI